MNICLSFDDGRCDAYDAYNILKKYSLKASFHVATGFVDSTYSTDAFGANKKPVTLGQLQEMFNYGMDISSHGDKHVMEDIDFLDSLKKLKFWGLIDNKVGFSIPNSSFSKEELNSFIKHNKENLLYIRAGRSPKCYSFRNKINYVLYHIFHLQHFYNSFNKHNLTKDIDKYLIYSLVVKKDTKISNLISFIEKYKENKDIKLVIMFHSIVESVKDEWDYSIKDFESLCCFLSKNVNVLTLKEMVE